MVHCLTSSVPVVKKLPRSNIVLMVVMTFGSADFVPSFSHSSAASASFSNRKRQYGIACRVLFDPFGNLGEILVLLANVVFFAEVDQIDYWLGSEEEERVNYFDLAFDCVSSVFQ